MGEVAKGWFERTSLATVGRDSSGFCAKGQQFVSRGYCECRGLQGYEMNLVVMSPPCHPPAGTDDIKGDETGRCGKMMW
jgi:hypothetical protein